MSPLDPPTFPWTVCCFNLCLCGTNQSDLFSYLTRNQNRSFRLVLLGHAHACARGCPGNRYWHLQEVFLAGRRPSQREDPRPRSSFSQILSDCSTIIFITISHGGRIHRGHSGRGPRSLWTRPRSLWTRPRSPWTRPSPSSRDPSECFHNGEWSPSAWR